MLVKRFRLEKIQRVLRLLVVRYNVQTVLVRFLRFVQPVLLLVAAPERDQRFAHVLAGVRVRRVDLEGRFEIVYGLLERATVGVQGTTRHQPFHVARIDAERLVQTLERFRVAALLKVLDAFGDRSEGGGGVSTNSSAKVAPDPILT